MQWRFSKESLFDRTPCWQPATQKASTQNRTDVWLCTTFDLFLNWSWCECCLATICIYADSFLFPFPTHTHTHTYTQTDTLWTDLHWHEASPHHLLQIIGTETVVGGDVREYATLACHKQLKLEPLWLYSVSSCMCETSHTPYTLCLCQNILKKELHAMALLSWNNASTGKEFSRTCPRKILSLLKTWPDQAILLPRRLTWLVYWQSRSFLCESFPLFPSLYILGSCGRTEDAMGSKPWVSQWQCRSKKKWIPT